MSLIFRDNGQIQHFMSNLIKVAATAAAITESNKPKKDYFSNWKEHCTFSLKCLAFCIFNVVYTV